MLTIFTTPKPFTGLEDVTQRNAIASWLALPIDKEVFLIGEDAGVAEVAAEIGGRHLASVETNEHGTPLVNDLFAKATEAATGDVLCYVNADIILTSELRDTLADVLVLGGEFLVIGRRWDLNITDRLDFGSLDWEEQIRQRVRHDGRLHSYTGIDYFLHSKGLFGEIPPFAVGRTAWDNWLVATALKRADHVIDATARILAIHQDHDYVGSRDRRPVWDGAEAGANRRLAAGRFATIANARYVMADTGIRRAAHPRELVSHPRRWLFRLRTWAPARATEERLLRLARPIRDRLRRSSPVQEVSKSA